MCFMADLVMQHEFWSVENMENGPLIRPLIKLKSPKIYVIIPKNLPPAGHLTT